VPAQRGAGDHHSRRRARAAARGGRPGPPGGHRDGAGPREADPRERLCRRLSHAVLRTLRGRRRGPRCASLDACHARSEDRGRHRHRWDGDDGRAHRRGHQRRHHRRHRRSEPRARRQAPPRRRQGGGAWLHRHALAFRLATGLVYAPGSYAATDEIVELARVAARQCGYYASHIRGEGASLLDAVREAIRVGHEADVPVQISHLKAAGRPNWGKVAEALALIDAANSDGLDVMADVYPYTASSTTLRTLLPDWTLEGGIDAMLARLRDPDARARIRREFEAPAAGQRLLD